MKGLVMAKNRRQCFYLKAAIIQLGQVVDLHVRSRVTSPVDLTWENSARWSRERK